MTAEDLQKGAMLVERMKELNENICILEKALEKETAFGKIKKFFFRCNEHNKISVEGGFMCFSGNLRVDREGMELLQNYFVNKLQETKIEFDNLGKGGE